MEVPALFIAGVWSGFAGCCPITSHPPTSSGGQSCSSLSHHYGQNLFHHLLTFSEAKVIPREVKAHWDWHLVCQPQHEQDWDEPDEPPPVFPVVWKPFKMCNGCLLLRRLLLTCYTVPLTQKGQLFRKLQSIIFSFTYTNNALFYLGGLCYGSKIRHYLLVKRSDQTNREWNLEGGHLQTNYVDKKPC